MIEIKVFSLETKRCLMLYLPFFYHALVPNTAIKIRDTSMFHIISICFFLM